ncbi:3-oxo-5-alpha-steroid 4-dehydrogenase 1 [Cryptococcus neoformans]|nr:3-oxo-5-alpha-steroid 4-dehydrogenase 1 [Cryptococcus neoformans var. grubii c45]OXB39824.1 3-oxo-5-alpha-steroid 4-dehydrogenase 1 [Cryptococcus neoformans var. grubii]OXC66157.1 3-oxo-5-alpha-steroid 4-dehydrogenase 1 [Cryptococcus neoformans var. grubii MW-RSA852]
MLPPKNFFPSLIIFHLFPLHSPITFFGLIDAPFGRFSRKVSRLNLNGNLSWAIMELVSPIAFLTTIVNSSHPSLNRPSRILSGLYLAHYVHRAIISPLILSPKRSPLHITVVLAAMLFNLLNGYLLAVGLAFYPPKEIGWQFVLGVVGWTIGFFGNVYHDEILNDLRRPPTKRIVMSHLPEDGASEKERYKVPRGGLFEWISFPNYLCEWLEWACWSFAANPYPLIAVPALPYLLRAPEYRDSHTVLSIISNFYWPSRLLAPSWAFVLAEVTSMLPRAVRGHAWYKEKFGNKYPKSRKAVIPGIL